MMRLYYFRQKYFELLIEESRILFNSPNNGAHWLTVELKGAKSNRDGLGAKIKVTTATGRMLYNHATMRVGSSSDCRVHFTRMLTRVKADQMLTVRETEEK